MADLLIYHSSPGNEILTERCEPLIYTANTNQLYNFELRSVEDKITSGREMREALGNYAQTIVKDAHKHPKELRDAGIIKPRLILPSEENLPPCHIEPFSYEPDPNFDCVGYNSLRKYCLESKLSPEEIKEALKNYDLFQNEEWLNEKFEDDSEKVYAHTYYDSHGIFWGWNESLFKWQMCDEIDLLNALQDAGVINTPYPKKRTELINKLKQKGRRNKPQEPKKRWIQFHNTVYDVLTGQSFKATPKYFMKNPLPFSVGESENTPTLDKLFREWVVEVTDLMPYTKSKVKPQDESYIQTLYEIIAYACCSEQFLQRIIAFTGSGANGKGTFSNLLTKFIGKENVYTTTLNALTTRNFETSGMMGKLVVFILEAESSEMKNANLLKSMTGEDQLRYEFKGKTPFTEDSSATPIMSTNSLPITPDKSVGFYRRWLNIDFPHQFPIKKGIVESIPSQEFNNLSKKVLRILRELYLRAAFTNEGTIEQREDKYEARSNPIITFLNKNFTEVPGSFFKLRDFFNEYTRFLKERHLRPVTIHKVSQILREEGFEISNRYLDKAQTDSARVIIGLQYNGSINLHDETRPKGITIQTINSSYTSHTPPTLHTTIEPKGYMNLPVKNDSYDSYFEDSWPSFKDSGLKELAEAQDG